MRKIVSIGILLLLLVNGLGFYSYYAIELLRIKADMKRALRNAPVHSLQTLTMSAEEYQEATVEDDEIFVNGNMFDVARKEVAPDGKITVYGMVDEKEGKLIVFIGEIFGKPVRTDFLPAVVLDFLNMIYVTASQSITLTVPFVLNHLTGGRHGKLKQQVVISEIFSPPRR